MTKIEDYEVKSKTLKKMKSKKVLTPPSPNPSDHFEEIIDDDSTFNMYCFLIELIDYLRTNCNENGMWRLLPTTDLESLSRLTSIHLSPYEWRVALELQTILVRLQNQAHSSLLHGMRTAK
ncbi:hypothetical protein AT251_15600 [Enterovibrio nigricans]|nr:hypothetical protein AT251_15600 [Enterovibrio nigricans]